jgi:Protein of unknown function (DUF1552)
MTPLSRRRFLAGLGASAGLAPLLPPLEALANGGALPKRLLFVGTANGTVREQWLPGFTQGALQLKTILQPLAAYASQLLVVDGLNYQVAIDKGVKDGHFGGMNGALTGRGNAIIDPNDDAGHSLALGISVDQHIAKSLSAGLAFRSLELGIEVEAYSPTVATYAYAGSKQPLLPENSPFLVWDRVFKNFSPTGQVDPVAERRKADQRSLLDFVAKDIKRVERGLGRSDKARLEAHLTSVRELETALGAVRPPSSLDACTRPARGTVIDTDPYSGNDNIPAISRMQMDLMVTAMACDLTRVGTLVYGRAGAQHRFTWLGPEFNSDPDNGPNDSTAGLHGLAHNESNPTSRAKLARCHAWYAGEVKALLDKLAAVPEGNGSMLDNTLVVWMNEMGTGSHSLEKTPWVLAGNLQGTFRTGRLVTSPGPHNRLLLSLTQAFGLPDSTFGDPDFCPGPLAGLT